MMIDDDFLDDLQDFRVGWDESFSSSHNTHSSPFTLGANYKYRTLQDLHRVEDSCMHSRTVSGSTGQIRDEKGRILKMTNTIRNSLCSLVSKLRLNSVSHPAEEEFPTQGGEIGEVIVRIHNLYCK